MTLENKIFIILNKITIIGIFLKNMLDMKKKGLKDFKSLNIIRFTKEKLFVSSHFLQLHSVHFGDCDSSITDWNIICCFVRTDLKKICYLKTDLDIILVLICYPVNTESVVFKENI